MPDRRDIPFRTHALGPSSGQSFRRMGAKSTKDSFDAAAADISAMSERFTFVGRDVAETALDIMRDNVIKYIQKGQGDFHGYSTTHLAATIGRWDPSQFVNSDSGRDAETKAMEWAVNNGVGSYVKDDGEETTIIENGALSSVKRVRGSTWSAEMGTFTPYAGLVEDGGSMQIASYGNNNAAITATWEANHMFKRGTFDSYAELENEMNKAVKDIIT